MEPELDTVEMSLNMGPQHPSTHGVFRMVLTLDGEKVVGVEPHIGYLHRGVEKLSENKAYRQVFVLFDRLDYLAAYNNELALVLALEEMAGIKPSERAEYIRVLLCELNRIASHLVFYGSMGADCGALTPFLYSFREWEGLVGFFEAVGGSRLMPNYFRVGGVKEDLPADWREGLGRLLSKLRRGIEECDALLKENEIFLARTIGVGVISGEEVIDYGLSGPNLRGSGVPYDLRRSEPYSIYPRLEFQVPVGERGDSWDRYWVRMEEMRQSLSIVEQVMEAIPEGEVMASGVPRVLKLPPGEVYVQAENPRGAFGVYLVSQGGERPYRLKIRSPSFCNLMALPRLLEGCYVADCVAILGSLDIVLGEVDR